MVEGGKVNFLKDLSWSNILWSIAFISVAFILWRLIRSFRDTMISRLDEKSERTVKRKAAITNASNFVKFLLMAITALSVLQINGLNVTSILTGLGIVGAAGALAAQDVGKDVIQGVRILTDEFFSVGDYIRYNGDDYQVIDFTIRTTILKSIASNNTVIVSNRNISEVTKLSGVEYLYVLLPFETDPEKADGIFTKCAEEIGHIKGITKSRYLGLREFEESSVQYQLTFTCKPIDRYGMRRAAMRIIKDNLAENNISIPYNRIIVMQ